MPKEVTVTAVRARSDDTALDTAASDAPLIDESIPRDTSLIDEPISPDASLPKKSDAPSRSSWLTDTLCVIVERALSADKPDIKGALAALAMLAERNESQSTSTDIAAVIRKARRRASDGTQT